MVDPITFDPIDGSAIADTFPESFAGEHVGWILPLILLVLAGAVAAALLSSIRQRKRHAMNYRNEQAAQRLQELVTQSEPPPNDEAVLPTIDTGFPVGASRVPSGITPVAAVPD